MTPRLKQLSDDAILAKVQSIIVDLKWIIRCSEELMLAGWPPEDIERERIELRNWRAIERWLEHKIKLSQEKR